MNRLTIDAAQHVLRHLASPQFAGPAGKFARFDGDAERFIAVRSELITLWQRMVQEYQSALREYYALISANPSNPQ